LNVHGVNNVRKTEIYTAELAVPEPSALEVHMAIGKLKKTQITRHGSNPSTIY
jgi:hypothetical protein